MAEKPHLFMLPHERYKMDEVQEEIQDVIHIALQTNGRLMRDPGQDKLKSKTLKESSGAFDEDEGPKLDDSKFSFTN